LVASPGFRFCPPNHVYLKPKVVQEQVGHSQVGVTLDTTRRTQVPYPPEFREEAVQLVREGGKSIGQVAGIADQLLRNWVKQADLDAGGRTDGLTTEERAELRRLRRENRVLREEREILKKTAAFFAQETQSKPGRPLSS
jgi:transposase